MQKNKHRPYLIFPTKAGRVTVARLLKEFENAEEEKRRQGDPAVDLGFLWRELDLDPEDY